MKERTETVRITLIIALVTVGIHYWIHTTPSGPPTSPSSSVSISPSPLPPAPGDSPTHRHQEAALPAPDAQLATEPTSSAMTSFRWKPGNLEFNDVAARKEIDAVFTRTIGNSAARTVTSVKKSFCSDFLKDVRKGPALSFFKALTRAVAPLALRHGSVCLMHLPPHQKAACLIARMLREDDGGGGGGGNSSDPVYLNSDCYQLLPCVLWATGRFTQRLTADVLDDVYRSASAHFADPSNKAMLALLRKNLVHTAAQQDERRWLSERFRAHATEAAKWERLAALGNSSGAARVDEMAQTPTDVRGAFQNDEVYLAQDSKNVLAEGVIAATPDDGMATRRSSDHSLASLNTVSALEAIAVLYRFVQARSATLGSPRGRPAVLLFSGDSQNRELFYRLIRLVRYVQRTDDGSGYTDISYFDTLGHADWVYSVFEDHDELKMFLLRAPASRTLPYGVASHLLSFSNVSNLLFHAVFMWDHLTAKPRDLVWSYAAASDAQTTAAAVASNPSPWAHGFRVAAHVQGTTVWETVLHTAMRNRLDAAALKSHSVLFSMTTTAKMAMSSDIAWTTPTSRIFGPKHPLSELTMPATLANGAFPRSSKILTYYNARNLEHFRWLYNLSARVEALAKSKEKKKEKVNPSFVALLDHAKLQLLPNVIMGDDRHFSCHAWASSFQKHFAASTRKRSLSVLLGDFPAIRRTSAAHSYCGLSADGSGAVGLPGSYSRKQLGDASYLPTFIARIISISGFSFRNLAYIDGKEDERMRQVGFPVRGSAYYASPKRGAQQLCRNRPQLLLVNVLISWMFDYASQTSIR